MTAQRARTAAARAALIEQARLDPAQVARFDQSVARMNSKLLGYGDQIVNQIASKEDLSTAQLLGLGRDVSGILYDGQQEIDGLVGSAAQVEKSTLQIWNFVDAEQWRPTVMDKFGALKARRGMNGAAGSSATPGGE